MDKDFRKDKAKYKLLSQVDQEQSYLSIDIVMHMSSGYVAKKRLRKYKYGFCKTLITA